MIPLFLTVYLSPDRKDFAEVPVSPETSCRDVVEVCQEPGETDCQLCQSWGGHERVVAEAENILELLQSWAPHRGEVRYVLRHQSHAQTGESRADHMTHGGQVTGVDRALENEGGVHSALEDLASRQQQQINAQKQLLLSKEQRLRRLKLQDEQETVRRLREKARDHEAKLQRIRALRGRVETKRVRNSKLVEEVEQIMALFQMKQRELVVAAATVQKLANQLESVRSRRLDGQLKGPPTHGLARLQRELQVRTRLNLERGSHLDHQRDAEAMEHRLNQLRQRLWSKKNSLRHKENLPVLSEGPQLGAGSRVAAVGPYLQSSSSISSQAPESELRPPPRPAKPSSVSEAPPPVPSQANHSEPDLTRKSPPPVPTRTNQSHSELRGEAPPPLPLRTNHIADIQLRDRQFGSKMAAVPPPLPKKSSDTSSFRSNTLPLPKHRPPPSAAVQPFSPDPSEPVRPLTPDPAQATPTALHRPKTVAASSIYSMYTSGGSVKRTKYQPGQGTLPRSKPRAHSKPSGSASEAEFSAEPISMVMKEEEGACRRRPLSPTKLLPFLLGGPRAGLQHAPRPLKKRSSLCEPEGAPQLLRLRYQRATLAALEVGATGAALEGATGAESSLQDLVKEDYKRESPDESLTPPPLPPRIPITDSAHRRLQAPPSQAPPSPTEDQTTPDQNQDLDQDETSPQPLLHSSPQALKSILRAPGSERSRASLRVRFNPVSLLLDSALEGEFDLVQRVIYEVADPSAANDEGITALHNAVCAGHMDIVRFLVQFGVNVNAADSDGWTPLHCAASCNNTQICKFLVESGAAVFAWTRSDSQTAADKCEDQEEDYAQCSQFLYGVQEKMGVMNRGLVFALWDFEPEEPDELRLFEGDRVTVLDRDRDQDRQSDALWWWVRGTDGEGYVPRNLLGLYPRIKPRQRSLA